MKESIEHNK